MKKISLKWLIIGSATLLILLGAAGAIYIWNDSNLKTTKSTSSSKSTQTTADKLKNAPTATVKTTTTGTVTSDMLNTDGSVDLSKIK